MSSWTPRSSAPSVTNPWYVKAGYGGYNRCIEINSATHSCLPNCVGYAWGRFCEGAGVTNCNLSTGNAVTFWTQADGYQRGQTPRVGSVIVWSGGSGAYAGYGHVAICEAINPDGSILISQSAASGAWWYTDTIWPGQRYGYKNQLSWLGFIYNPYIDDPIPGPDPGPDPGPPGADGFPWWLLIPILKTKRR